MSSSQHSNDKAVSAGIGYSIGNYLIKGIAFLSVPIFARLMSAAEFGLYGAFSAYESILYLAAGLAIHNSYKNAKLRYSEEGGTLYDSYVSDSMLLVPAQSGVLLLLAVVFRNPLSRLTGLPVPALFLLVIYSFGAAVLSCWYSHASLEYDHVSYLRVSGLYAVGSAAAGILLILTLFKDAPAAGRMTGTAIVMAVLSIYIITVLVRRAPVRKFREMMHWGILYSIPTIPGSISQTLLAEIDKIMLLRMKGAKAAGIYTFIFQIYLIAGVALQSLESVWTPWFYEKYHEKSILRIRRGICLCILLMAVFHSCLILAAPELVLILGGRNYEGGSLLAFPMLCGGFFAFIALFPSVLELYQGKTALNAAVCAVSAAVNLILGLIFIPLYGAEAAAVTVLFSHAFYAALHFFAAGRLPGRDDIFPRRALLSGCFFVLAAALFACFAADSPVPRWSILIVIFVAGALYGEKHYRLVSTLIHHIRKRR